MEWFTALSVSVNSQHFATCTMKISKLWNGPEFSYWCPTHFVLQPHPLICRWLHNQSEHVLYGQNCKMNNIEGVVMFQVQLSQGDRSENIPTRDKVSRLIFIFMLYETRSLLPSKGDQVVSLRFHLSARTCCF